ncbi:hypothetical protein Bca4012_072778 [Brassica carinata]
MVTTEQLAPLTAVLAPLTGNIDAPTTTIHIQLFNTYRTDGAKNQTTEHREKPLTLSGPSSSVDLSKWCSYHKVKGPEKKECKQLVEAFLTSYEKGTSNVKPRK